MRRNFNPKLTARDLWGSDRPAPTILFNGLSLAPGGGHSVLTNYLRCFHALRPDWRLILLRGPLNPKIDAEIDGVCHLHCGQEVVGLRRRTLWERRNLSNACRDLGADIYFGPNGIYHNAITAPQCLLVQDPGPYVLKAKDFRDALRSFLLRRAWNRAVRKADCMGYTSQYMRELIVRGTAPEKRHLIAYNGVSDRMLDAAQEPALPLGQRQPFILAVSVFGYYKNFETLIRALAILRATPRFAHFRLRVFGQNVGSDAYIARLKNEIRDASLSDAVSLEIDRPWSEIEEAFRNASLFSLTSLCESFGIPALESMAFGLPTVLGDCCAIPEVAGDAAVLVPPSDPAAVARAWERLLTDAQEHQRLQLAGRERCRQFTWTSTVKAWIDVMEGLMASRSQR